METLRIDAHQHFWIYNPEKHSWISEEMGLLKRDFLPEGLHKELANAKIDGCIAVQADQTEEETNFLVQLAKENAFIKGVVGWVDLRADTLENRLEFFSKEKIIRGFRHVVQAEPDDKFMLRDNFVRGIKMLKKYNFTYDILIYPKQLDAALQLVKLFPDQRFVIDHIAKPEIKRGEIKEWGKKIRPFKGLSNVWCKVSGLVTEADWKRWKKEDFTKYLDIVVEVFGTEKLIYGSDWPVCLLGGSYGQVGAIVYDYFDMFSEDEKNAMYGGNAVTFYGL